VVDCVQWVEMYEKVWIYTSDASPSAIYFGSVSYIPSRTLAYKARVTPIVDGRGRIELFDTLSEAQRWIETVLVEAELARSKSPMTEMKWHQAVDKRSWSWMKGFRIVAQVRWAPRVDGWRVGYCSSRTGHIVWRHPCEGIPELDDAKAAAEALVIEHRLANG
jgi:hypothetical protein